MRWKNLIEPMNLAALVTIAAIAATLVGLPRAQWPLVYGLLLAFTLLMFVVDSESTFPKQLRNAALSVMGLITLLLLWQFPRAGALPILTVIFAAMVAGHWSPRWATLALLGGNGVVWWILHRAGHDHALMSVVLVGCFQLFAALTVHYARSAEDARDRLAAVNAELLATRSLLADTSRDAERMRLARELHDVAGHKLTALRLNLRVLSSADDASPQLKLADQLSADLLGDIRGVVRALRDVDGLDIATALQALAAPFPRPRLSVELDASGRITDPARAEVILRIVQEALTNAARHGEARTLHVRLSHDGAWWTLHVEDDANDARRARWPVREGHGLSGMRERVAALGGRIAISRNARGGVAIEAGLPT